jgi:hypothetical protein
MWTLALIKKENGQVMEALQLLQECVPLLKQNLGENHPHTLRFSAYLAEWELEGLDF